MKKGIYFFSDVHLGAGEQEGETQKEKKLLKFIEFLKQEAHAVYILGDLYDFWFEYKSVIPKAHFFITCKLGELAQKAKVTYLGGNHDFWVGEFFQRQLGITYSEKPISVIHQDKRIYLHHGDGLIKKDVGYRFLRRILRNPINITLFRLIHPDIAFWIAKHTSHQSRAYTTIKKFVNADLDMQSFAQQKINEGHDAVILAHTHLPNKIELNGGQYLNTGDWIKHFSYVELRDGEFYLKYADF